jgi:transposase
MIPNDALSTAIAALRGHRLRAVAVDDFGAILRMLADRHHDLTSLHTQAVCRLHANLIPGGLSGRLSHAAAARMLATIEVCDGVMAERKQQAADLLGDVGRLDLELAAIKARITVAIKAANTSLTDIHGVGPVVAALVIGHSGDIGRFASRDHYASHNGSAPIEASSGPKKRHRLNTRGNRQLNHALHMIAVTQVGHDTPGRDYYQRKLTEGKTKKEALRTLKRRISDAVYRQLVSDAQ